MPRVLNFKKIFQKQPEPRPAFKQFNALNVLEGSVLREILLLKEKELFSRNGFSFEEKKVFFLHEPGTHSLAEKIVWGRGDCLHYQTSPDPSVPISAPNFFPVSGDLKPLSVPNGIFDAVLVPGASRSDRDHTLLLPEMGRILKNGGRFLLTVIHPALELFLCNQNPASVSRARFGLEQYSSNLLSHQLYLESIREEAIDSSVKAFFEEEDFEELIGIPLVLYLRAVKYVSG